MGLTVFHGIFPHIHTGCGGVFRAILSDPQKTVIDLNHGMPIGETKRYQIPSLFGYFTKVGSSRWVRLIRGSIYWSIYQWNFFLGYLVSSFVTLLGEKHTSFWSIWWFYSFVADTYSHVSGFVLSTLVAYEFLGNCPLVGERSVQILSVLLYLYMYHYIR